MLPRTAAAGLLLVLLPGGAAQTFNGQTVWTLAAANQPCDSRCNAFRPGSSCNTARQSLVNTNERIGIVAGAMTAMTCASVNSVDTDGVPYYDPSTLRAWIVPLPTMRIVPSRTYVQLR